MTISKLEREVTKMITRLKKDKMALDEDDRGGEGICRFNSIHAELLLIMIIYHS